MMLSTEIYVNDVSASADFFAKFFNFEIKYLEKNFATLWLGKTRLILNSLNLQEFTKPNPVLKKGALNYLGAGVELVISVNNLEEIYSKLQNEGIKPTPIKQQAWGLRDFRFITEDGHYIRVTEPDDSVKSATQ